MAKIAANEKDEEAATAAKIAADKAAAKKSENSVSEIDDQIT